MEPPLVGNTVQITKMSYVDMPFNRVVPCADPVYLRSPRCLFERYCPLEAKNPRGYLHQVMRCAIMDHRWEAVHTSIHPISLDEPADEEGITPYGDLLPSPSSMPCDTRREEKRTAALYAALGRLPLEDQMYLCRVYGINAYTPTLPTEGRFAGRLPDSPRDGKLVSHHAYTWLRRDEALARVICASDYSACGRV